MIVATIVAPVVVRIVAPIVPLFNILVGCLWQCFALPNSNSVTQSSSSSATVTRNFSS